jgi:hypothetical protein
MSLNIVNHHGGRSKFIPQPYVVTADRCNMICEKYTQNTSSVMKERLSEKLQNCRLISFSLCLYTLEFNPMHFPFVRLPPPLPPQSI